MCLYGSVAALYEWISISSSHTLSGVLCSGQPGPGTHIKAVFVCSGEQVSICACSTVCMRACVCVCASIHACKCMCVCVRCVWVWVKERNRERWDWPGCLPLPQEQVWPFSGLIFTACSTCLLNTEKSVILWAIKQLIDKVILSGKAWTFISKLQVHSLTCYLMSCKIYACY